MKAVVVRYTVKPEFIEENRANIERVVAEASALNDAGFRYQAFQSKDDPAQFTHIGFYADDAAQERATDLDSFRAFQSALKASRPVSPPKATWLDFIGSTRPLVE